MDTADVIRCAGAAHFGILIASALVPFRLDWRNDLARLPRLHRQMYWTYGGYIVGCILAFAGISLFCAEELVSGSRLARCFAGFVAVFWGVRVALQAVYDSGPYLTAAWLRLGYHALTVVFAALAVVYGTLAAGWLN